MRTRSQHKKERRLAPRWSAAGAIAVSLSLVGGCAGGVGAGGGSGSDDDSAGLAPGATKEEYAEALAGMDPVTLTLQSTASSADDVAAYRSNELKRSVEDLSDGKITIDVVYGPSIAAYTEVDSALADGRIDLAYMIPIYQPQDYPAFSMLAAGTGLVGTSPLTEELTINAAMLEVAYGTDALFEEYEARGVTPLIPFNATSSVMAMCTDAHESLEDWQGSVVSIGSQSTLAQAEALGATATSLEYTETFEALQRHVVDCSLATTLSATMTGLSEVAPHVAYSSTAGFARGAGAFVAGVDYENLPLAARQLIFDQMGEAFKNSRRADLEGTHRLMEALAEDDGSMHELDEASSDAMVDSIHDIVDPALAEEIDTSMERWRTIVEELGYVDDGDFDTFPEWHDNTEEALDAYAERVYEELMLSHRPE